MSDEPIIIPENKSIVPVGPKLPTIWQPKRALPLLVGAAATLVWLGSELVKRNANPGTIEIPDRQPIQIRRPRKVKLQRVDRTQRGRRMIVHYTVQWSVHVWKDD